MNIYSYMRLIYDLILFVILSVASAMGHFIRKKKATPKMKRRLTQIPQGVKRPFHGRSTNRQMQTAVINALRYFRRERLNGGPPLPVNQVR